MKVDVFVVSQNAPDDLSGLDTLVQTQQLNPANIVAVMGKTEGNGCVNDFTRGFAIQTLKSYLQAKVEANQIIYVMSGGTEGVISPHLTVFTRQPDTSAELHWGLALGISRTRDFLPSEIGTLTMVEVVATAVEEAIADANLALSDVHFVQIKCPLLTSRRQAGVVTITPDSYKSMSYSRGAAALGVAVAMQEVAREKLQLTDICCNYGLYSAVASTSAGVELQNCEIIVLGNSPTSSSPYVIGHSVMQHALDAAAVQRAIQQTGQPLSQVVNIFAKAEADPAGMILNCRHTMLDDSDINHTRMARAVVGAVIAAVAQNPRVYVSGGSEHQGPSGGGPIAVIARL